MSLNRIFSKLLPSSSTLPQPSPPKKTKIQKITKKERDIFPAGFFLGEFFPGIFSSGVIFPETCYGKSMWKLLPKIFELIALMLSLSLKSSKYLNKNWVAVHVNAVWVVMWKFTDDWYLYIEAAVQKYFGK